ncbi:ankyrin repeat-containing domain protein [Xylaria arbuscula]|nr:ankyrin repeat-containing domain protein [Xylaria arbuscula]
MSSDNWEQYKAIICHLYLTENRRLRDVALYMQQEHSFSKKNHQYEFQLKKWGVRKNARKEDWKDLRRRLKKREGKQSEVTRFGIPLSPRKIRKELQRYTHIPTASEFGKRSPSPENLNGVIVRAQTPVLIEKVTWPSLSWFNFKNTVLLPTLCDPSSFLRVFSTTLTSRPLDFDFQEGIPFDPLYGILGHRVDVRKGIFRFTRALPDDNVNEQQGTNTVAQKDPLFSTAAETLKLIFFHISNNTIPSFVIPSQENIDEFVLQFVEAVLRTNLEMLSRILFGRCITTQVIREAVYKSAIREKHYIVVSRLLESKSVDPDLTLPNFCYRTNIFTLNRGSLRLGWDSRKFVWSGIKEAAYSSDTRLGKLLLDAGASLGDDLTTDILEITCAASGDPNSRLQFMQLLAEHGAFNKHSALRCPCQGSKLISPIAISIARSDNQMLEFLIGKEASINISQYSEDARCKCCANWSADVLKGLKIGCTPLHIAVASGNEELIERLLRPVISHPPQVSMHVICKAILVSCLAGDVDTASTLLGRHPSLVANDSAWTRITPLAATAWSKEDSTIAEMLLGLGADIGPTQNDRLCETSMLAPIHVAAYHGNTGLVQKLLDRGANCNVRFKTYFYPLLHGGDTFHGSPLQYALAGRNVETAKLLMPYSNLLGWELIEALYLKDDALISAITSRGIDVTWARPSPFSSRTILEAAIETSNKEVIRFYFASGGKYGSKALWLATEAAIRSKDHSIVRLLASHRPVGEIDSGEATSLVLAIHEREWELVFFLLQDPFLPGLALQTEALARSPRGEIQSPLWAAILSENRSVIDAITNRGYIPQPQDIWALRVDIHESIRQIFWCRFPLETMDLSCRKALVFLAIYHQNRQKLNQYIKLVDCINFSCPPVFPPVLRDRLRSAVSPLHLAALNGDTESVRILLDAGAGVNCVYLESDKRETALQYAASQGNLDVVRLLLDAGAEVDYVYLESGEMALQYAASGGNLDVVRLLLDRGARVNPAPPLRIGATALQYSAILGDLNMAQLLISRGADINALPARDKGRTALEGASEHGRLDMIQFLLEMGARINGEMRIYYVRSVMFAKNENHHAIANYLKKYGSWGDRDEVLHDRHFICDEDIHFRYEEEIDDWRIRMTESRRDNPGERDLGWCLKRDSSSAELNSSSDESEENEEEEKRNKNDHNKDDYDKPPGASYDAEFSSQAWYDMDLTIAGPSNLNNKGKQVMAYDLSSSQMSTSRRVIEVDDEIEDANVAQSDVGYNVAEGGTGDRYATNQLELWEHTSKSRQGIYHFEGSSRTPEINHVNSQVLGLDEMETESAGGAFFGVSWAEAVGYPEGQLEVWRPGSIVGGGLNTETSNYGLGNDPTDGENITLDVAEEEWEGPFTGFDPLTFLSV